MLSCDRYHFICSSVLRSVEFVFTPGPGPGPCPGPGPGPGPCPGPRLMCCDTLETNVTRVNNPIRINDNEKTVKRNAQEKSVEDIRAAEVLNKKFRAIFTCTVFCEETDVSCTIVLISRHVGIDNIVLYMYYRYMHAWGMFLCLIVYV